MAVEARRSAASPSVHLRRRVALAALAATVATAVGSAPTPAEWTAFALLLPLAAAAPFFLVSVGRNHGFHPGPAFIVAGALVLPPALLVGLVVAFHLPSIWRAQRSLVYQAFNVSDYTLSALGAWAVAAAVGTGSNASFALTGLSAAAVFVLVNHGLLAIMLRLGRGHTFRESGLFSATGSESSSCSPGSASPSVRSPSSIRGSCRP